MQQGQEIGALARSLYPDGVNASESGAADATKALMASGCEVIFEATAFADPFVAKADIIQRDGCGWHVIEVKSSFADTSSLNEIVDDLAYTVMVLVRSGVQVVKASLLLLARTYKFGDAPDRLFECLDKTGEVLARAAEFDKQADNAGVLFHDMPPTPVLGSTCRNCVHFTSQCLGAGIAHTVLEIPGLHHRKLARLAAESVVDLAAVPNDLGLNARQERTRQSAMSGQLIVESDLGKALETISWPCHYLDFETVATVQPLYSGHGCHHQVLTQFSVHRRDSVDSTPQHSEFLADAAEDCQKQLAEALVNAVEPHGSILVYSSFEQTRIKALIAAFPELATPLKAILDRLFDLHTCIVNYVCHPDFKGSSSIKKVLPALVPDLSYQELAIRDGDTAITRFARMARGEIAAADVSLTRLELFHYCRLDTLAMVKLHDALFKLASA
jgi:predicted RecB family nuclease